MPRFAPDPETGQLHLEDAGRRIAPGDGLKPEPKASDAPAPGRSLPKMSTLGQVIDLALQEQLTGLKGRSINKLSPVHISMCVDKALGFTNREIAAKYEVTPVTVSYALQHPDADVIIGRFLGAIADEAADPITRLQGYAHEAISVKMDIMRNSKSETLRNVVATDILDRAGYGARRKVEVTTTKFEDTAPRDVSLLNRLSTALEESATAGSIGFSQFVSTPKSGMLKPPQEVAVAAKDGSVDPPGIGEADSAKDILPAVPSGAHTRERETHVSGSPRLDLTEPRLDLTEDSQRVA